MKKNELRTPKLTDFDSYNVAVERLEKVRGDWTTVRRKINELTDKLFSAEFRHAVASRIATGENADELVEGERSLQDLREREILLRSAVDIAEKNLRKAFNEAKNQILTIRQPEHRLSALRIAEACDKLADALAQEVRLRDEIVRELDSIGFWKNIMPTAGRDSIQETVERLQKSAMENLAYSREGVETAVVTTTPELAFSE